MPNSIGKHCRCHPTIVIIVWPAMMTDGAMTIDSSMVNICRGHRTRRSYDEVGSAKLLWVAWCRRQLYRYGHMFLGQGSAR